MNWCLMLLVGASTIGLGYVGFANYHAAQGESVSPFGLLYLTLQLFTLESGAIRTNAPWQLDVARFLAPVVPGWAIVMTLAALFRRQWQAALFRLARGHVVVCGLSRKGMYLARDFREQGCRVAVIEKDEGNDYIQTCRDEGILVLHGDATDESLLLRAGADHARYVIAVCGDDGTNVEIGLNVRNLVNRPCGSQQEPVTCLIHITDLNTYEVFIQHGILNSSDSVFEARVFNIYENSARMIFHEYALPGELPDSNRAPHLVIAGFGNMGEAVLLQAAKSAHYAHGKTARITVLDKDAHRRKEAFWAKCPQFEMACAAEFIEVELTGTSVKTLIQQWAAEKEHELCLVLCLDDDTLNLKLALQLASVCTDRNIPVLLRISESIGLAKLFDSRLTHKDWPGILNPFGLLHQLCNGDILVDEPLDLLARQVHKNYVKNQLADGQPAHTASLQPWNLLEPTLKDSNRQQADHIPVKLRAMGCFMAPRGSLPSPVSAFSAGEIELAAEMEHNRWNAERFLNGWTFGEKNVEKKTSPYLVPWPALPGKIQDYDRNTVKELPELLSQIGLEIYRHSDCDTLSTQRA